MLLKISVCLGIILTCQLGKAIARRSGGIGYRSNNIRGPYDINPTIHFKDVTGRSDEDDTSPFLLGADNGAGVFGADDGGSQSGRRGNIQGLHDINPNIHFKGMTGRSDEGETSTFVVGTDNGQGVLGTEDGGSHSGRRGNILGPYDINPNVHFIDVTGRIDEGETSPFLVGADNGQGVLGADDGASQSGRRGNILGPYDINPNVHFKDVTGRSDEGETSPFLVGADNGQGVFGADGGGGASGGPRTILGANDINNNIRFDDIHSGDTLVPNFGAAGVGWNNNNKVDPLLGTDTGGGVSRGTVLGANDINENVVFDLNDAGEGLVGPPKNPIGMDTNKNGPYGFDGNCEYINRVCQCHNQGRGGGGGGGGWGPGGGGIVTPQFQMDDYQEAEYADFAHFEQGDMPENALK